jgi:hypothetical protein
MLVDEPDDHFDGRSSSTWAKYADALRRISFARFSSRFSCSSRFIFSASSLLNPGLAPASDLSLTHPRPQRLGSDSQLLSDPLHRAVIGAQLLAELTHRTHRTVLLSF